MGVTPQGEAADCKSVAEKHVGFDSLHSHQNMEPSSKWHRNPPFQGVQCGFESRRLYQL
jgi:hypothetical protein